MRCKVWGDSGRIVRYPLLISLAYSTCLPSCPYWRPCLVQSGRSERAMNSPAVATDAPDGLQLVCAGAPQRLSPRAGLLLSPGRAPIGTAQYSLATGHERGDPEFPANSTNFPNNPTYLPQTNKAISHTAFQHVFPENSTLIGTHLLGKSTILSAL